MTYDPEQDLWLSRDEVAHRYGLPRTTLAQWASKGLGPRYAKIGRHTRYRLSDLIAWEQTQMRGGAASKVGV